jgi:hypothetical protein
MQAAEKASYASLRSIASLQRTGQVRLRSSILRAPRLSDLFEQPANTMCKKVLVLLVTLGEDTARLFGRIAGRVLDDSESGDTSGSRCERAVDAT